MTRSLLTCAASAAAVALAACSPDLPDPSCAADENCPTGTICGADAKCHAGVHTAAAVAISGPASLLANESATFTATVTDANGHALPGAAVIWSSTVAGALQIVPSGLSAAVTGKSLGTTRLAASSGSASSSLPIAVAPAKLECSPASVNLARSVRNGTTILGSTKLVAKDGAGSVVPMPTGLTWGAGLSETHSGPLADFNFLVPGAPDAQGSIQLFFDTYAATGTVVSVQIGALGKQAALTVTVQ